MFRDFFSGKLKGMIGKEYGGLDIFRSEFGIKNLQSTRNDSKKVVAEVIKQEANLWNRRLGDPSLQTPRHLDVAQSNEELNDCHVCPIAKQEGLSFPNSKSRASMKLDIVHMDIWGHTKHPL